jgi:hypothetical protein
MATSAIRGMLGGLLVPLFSITVLAQGLSFEIVRGGESEKAGEKGLYMPGMFRQENEDGRVSILRLDKELMISIDPAKKTYSETTFKELETQVKQGRMKSDVAMKMRLAEMPPEQRKMIEERMGAMTGHHVEAKVEIVETGKQRTIDGYSCKGYRLMRDGTEIEMVWATKDIPNFAVVRKDFQRIASFFTSLTGGRGAFASLEKIDGFPIERSGTTDTRERITKIQKGSFPVSVFEIPPGYTKEKSQSEEDDK